MYNDSVENQPEATGIDSPNATYFIPSEAAEDKQNKYETYWRYNEGLWTSRNQVNKSEEWRRDRRSLLNSIASELELTSAQKERAKSRFSDIDLWSNKTSRQQRLEASCFGICALVFNEDVMPQRDESCVYLPHKDDKENPSHFVAAKEEIGLEDNEIEYAINQILKIVCGNND